MKIKTFEESIYDIVALGEVMLRLDPGEGRIRTARSFQVCEGGGEYNVARGLRRCFEMRGAIVTALPDNEIGRLVEDLMLTGGLDLKYVKWRKYDGIGRNVRSGLNFTERGYGVRGAVGVSDRSNTAISQMVPKDIDWHKIFSQGVRWFHTGGIFAALSESTASVAAVAMETARKYGTVVSYDLNYRPSLWEGIGGSERARKVNRELAKYVDVIFGNEEDFTACLGLEVEGIDKNLTELSTSGFKKMIDQVRKEFPNLKVIATTLRGVHSASSNDWRAIAWSEEEGFVESKQRQKLEIFDRVGGGDSFASGLIYGLMELKSLQVAVEYGAAHGALAMTTPGDTTMVSVADVKKLVEGKSARVAR